MNLEVKRSTLIAIFTCIGLLFFTGIVNMLYRSLTSDIGGDTLSADAAGNPIKKLVGMGLLLTCLFYSIRYKLLLNKNYLIKNLWILIFVLYVLLSCLWSVEPATTFRRSLFLLSLVFFAGYLSRFYTIETIFTYIGYIVAFTALAGLVKAVIFPADSFVAGGLREGAFLGVYFEKNGGARAYMMGITLLLPAIFANNRKALCAACVCLLCILMARSASAILLLTIGVFTFIYLNKLVISNKYSINKSSYWAGIVTYFIVLFLAYQAYEFIFSLVGRDATLTNRTLIWEILLPLIQEKISLGYGYGAFWVSSGGDEFIERWEYIGNAHNGYLELLLHGGIPLLIIFIIMTVKGFINSVNNACLVQYAMQYNTSIAIIVQLLISNFIAYSLPNHNSLDFFIFTLVLFYANQQQRMKASES